MANKNSRVNGKGGESMWIADGEFCFRTNNKVQRIPADSVSFIDILNVEEARKLVNSTELVPYGVWTNEMKSSSGKTMFLAATNDECCWVMEIAKSQVPNAGEFVRNFAPAIEEKERAKVPTRAINTPLGGLLTIGEIVCLLGAVFALYNFQQPIIAIVLSVAAAVMFFFVK